ncbi:MAG: NERD domain-containing protein/DEAD/DEAH box helicase [Deltaproteobacteria bacterium]
MAIMIPDDVAQFSTDGERQFYGFLKTAAKPDSKYTAWYLPDINGREPDFILYCKDTGLTIFEVKDWSLFQIQEANPTHFIIALDGHPQKLENPLKQAKTYSHFLMDKIHEDRRLLSNDPLHSGNSKIPIAEGVVFPNINKHEYIGKLLNQVIQATKVFFWDDLNPQSDICRDASGQCFSNALQQMFPPLFQFNLTPNELQHLRQLMFPSIRIEMPDRDPGGQRLHEKQRIKLLDHHQEVIARKFDRGHRIISGPSGSGKTLILVHQAAMLKQYNFGVKRILFVCYNITLVNFIRRCLAEKKVPLGENGVDVLHFFELCAKILGESVSCENEETAYYDMVIEETLRKATDFTKKYDAVLVDEGQDFSDDMYRIVVSLLNPVTNHLSIALDENQNIYRKTQTWKNLGIQVCGQVQQLSWMYRNSSAIADFARRFINEKNEEPPPQVQPIQDYQTTPGPEPEIRQFPTLDELIHHVVRQVDHLHNNEGYPLSEIAVIYTQKSPHRLPDIHLPDLMTKALENQGILCNWIAEDYHSKRSYDVTTQSVTISTIHSVKGFDYACVFVIGLDWLDETRWTAEQVKKLTYVAITRARERLFISHIDATDICKKCREIAR